MRVRDERAGHRDEIRVALRQHLLRHVGPGDAADRHDGNIHRLLDRRRQRNEGGLRDIHATVVEPLREWVRVVA
jgi:hypothetical protein